MEIAHGLPNDSPRASLLSLVRGARARWRLRVALRGLVVALAVLLAAIVLASWAMDAAAWSERAVIAARAVVWAAALGLLGWLVVRPFLRRVPEERVALYLEEREPTLEQSVISALALDAASPSPLGDRLVDSALGRLHAVGGGRRVEARPIRDWGIALAALATIATLLFVTGPAALRHGASTLFTPWRSAAAASLYAVDVQPGDTTIARGGDLAVRAQARGFRAERVELVVYRTDSATWTRVPMRTDSSGAYTAVLFGVAARADYYVEADGVRSPSFKIAVADLPYAGNIDLEYRFPAYTGRAPDTVKGGGDIVALAGTQVVVRVTPTRPTAAGRLVLDYGDTVALAPASDGTLAGTLRVSRSGFYVVQLQGPDGRMLPASLDYAVDVIEDRVPTVRITQPGRDTKPTSVEEVFIEASAEDDFGIDRLELVYQVNGGAEKVVPLHASSGRRTPEISGSHTLALEELGVQAGDVVSYHARAADNDRVKGPKRVASDIYFMNVRPFGRDYKQQQGGGGGGGGQAGEPPSALSQAQREIVAGTFKTERDRASTPAPQFAEDVATLARGQAQLRERTAQLIAKLHSRGVASQDTNFAKIAKLLQQASDEMEVAAKALSSRDPKGALPAEQRALAQLQRAEAVFRDVMVSFGGENSGGGGGGQQSNPEDLADLFELERDKLRNQYESVDRARQQEQGDAQVDEVQERLRRLAARQQQENERLRRKLDSLGAQGASRGGGGGGAQRELAQEAEKAARQLERLAREQSQPELAESARRLQEAADAMRRSAASSDARGLADANSALERLRDAQRRLEQERGGRAGRDAADALKEARALAEEERRVREEMQRLAEAGRDPANELSREQRTRALSERKGEMADRVRSLRDRLDRQALEARREQREAARQLQQAAEGVRNGKLEERIRASRALVDEPGSDYARALEDQIATGLDTLVSALGRAQQAASAAGQQPGGQSLDRARELVRGLASLDERLRQRAEQSAREGSQQQQGQAGRQGQDGQQGQQGQQGQSGRQGQEGQQGQQGQAGRQGQEGQQGQQGQGGQQSAQGQQGQRGGQSQQPGAAQGASGQRSPVQGGGGAPRPSDGTERLASGALGAPQAPRVGAAEARQFARELRERIAEAEALRRDLRAQGQDVGELDRLIGQLRGAGAQNAWSTDAGDTKQLRSQVLDGFKAFEFDLRRAAAAADAPQVRLGRSSEAPAEYRELVEKYYKALSGGKP